MASSIDVNSYTLKFWSCSSIDAVNVLPFCFIVNGEGVSLSASALCVECSFYVCKWVNTNYFSCYNMQHVSFLCLCYDYLASKFFHFELKLTRMFLLQKF